ncbi:MAG: hypothetical protein WCK47_08135 [bacterium]
MMKRLTKSLIAAAVSMSCVCGFASAPVLLDLPSINIGDLEEGAENNFFIYSNAFKFDFYVKDNDTSLSALIWSFDEATFPGESPEVPWFNINGIGAVLLGDAAIAADAAAGYPAHLNPSGKNIRSGNTFASFRDIVFSPASGSPPFPPPTEPAKSRHAVGKVVYFYVSDGTPGNTQRKATIVKSTDNTYDSKSGGYVYTVVQDDTFTTGDPYSTGPGGWLFVEGYGSAKGYSSANHAITTAISAEAGKFRSGSWQSNYVEWLPYTMVGTENVVRAKYYIYASGQAAKNEIPNLRLRLTVSSAVNSMLEVYGTVNGAHDATYQELAPSQDPARPSLYRVDMWPIDVPKMSDGLAGFSRAWDLYGDMPQFKGTLGMAESVIGTYPRSEIATTVVAPSKTYNPSDLLTYFPADNQTLLYIPGVVVGDFPTSDTGALPSQLPTIVESSVTGVLLDCANVPTNRVGAPVRDFNPPQDYTDIPSLVRMDENKQYVLRWHLTSTQQLNSQSQIRMRARGIGFAWSQKLEVGGAQAAGSYSNAMAQEVVPGVGSLNPDKLTPGENGGWYTMIMQTALSQDIRPDVPGSTIAEKMPLISALPGSGSPSFAPGKDRAIRMGIDILNTISGGPLKNQEKGNVLIDKLELRVYNLAIDQ